MTRGRRADRARCPCGKPASRAGGRYCSRNCAAVARDTRIQKRCVCGTVFEVQASRAGERQYCSRTCRYAAARKHERPPSNERACEVCGQVFSLAGKQADVRFCSRICADTAKQKALQRLVCEVCGTERLYPTSRRVGRYCSRACSSQAQRRQEARVCQRTGCLTRFTVWPARLKTGGGKFCSKTCQNLSRRHRTTLVCQEPSCGRSFDATAGELRKGRRFCSRDCYGRSLAMPRGGREEHQCQHCGVPFPVFKSQVRRGRGGFCSRSCAYAARRRPRATRSCVHCGQAFHTYPSETGRRYCSRTCYRRAIAGRTFACRVCGHTERRPAWRRQRFCSLTCAHEGRRPRSRSAVVVERNARIVQLRGNGATTKEIQRALHDEFGEWFKLATIRVAVHREMTRPGTARDK